MNAVKLDGRLVTSLTVQVMEGFNVIRVDPEVLEAIRKFEKPVGPPGPQTDSAGRETLELRPAGTGTIERFGSALMEGERQFQVAPTWNSDVPETREIVQGKDEPSQPVQQLYHLDVAAQSLQDVAARDAEEAKANEETARRLLAEEQKLTERLSEDLQFLGGLDEEASKMFKTGIRTGVDLIFDPSRATTPEIEQEQIVVRTDPFLAGAKRSFSTVPIPIAKMLQQEQVLDPRETVGGSMSVLGAKTLPRGGPLFQSNPPHRRDEDEDGPTEPDSWEERTASKHSFTVAVEERKLQERQGTPSRDDSTRGQT